MIYISAQPDEHYFLWQLKVMLYNFNSIDIPSKNVHIVIGYDPIKGINPSYLEFDCHNNYGKLFFYKDERGSTNYRSTIRPHILRKHFLTYPILSQKVIFYHDCDIIFKERINEKLLSSTKKCFVSDTGKYLNINYLNRFEGILHEMSAVVGIDVKTLIKNDTNTGGAQYVLKNCDNELWLKVESDSEKLFNLMNIYNAGKEKTNQIQAWCADMWALYWNLLKLDKQVEVHKELDFCWPKNPIDRWNETKILHNAGVGIYDDGFFCKGKYKSINPFFLNHHIYIKDKCTIKYVEVIKNLELKIILDSILSLDFIIPYYIRSNFSQIDIKCIRQNIIVLLSEILDEIGITHSEKELVLHTAFMLDIKRYFLDEERLTNLKNWFDKVFSAKMISANYSKTKLKASRKYLLAN